jgi:hypothetical protein
MPTGLVFISGPLDAAQYTYRAQCIYLFFIRKVLCICIFHLFVLIRKVLCICIFTRESVQILQMYIYPHTVHLNLIYQ